MERLYKFATRDRTQRAVCRSGAGAFVGLANSMFGAFTGATNVEATNKANLRIARANNEFNLDLAREQNAYNLRQWERNNQYNSPVEQKKRLLAAGYNPYLQGEVSSPESSPVTAADTKPAESVTYQSAAPYIADAVPRAITAMSQLQEQEQRDIDIQFARTTLADRALQVHNEAKKSGSDAAIAASDALVRDAFNNANVNNTQADTSVKRSQAALTDAQAEEQRVRNLYADQREFHTVQNMIKQGLNLDEITRKTKADRELVRKQIETFDNRLQAEIAVMYSQVAMNNETTRYIGYNAYTNRLNALNNPYQILKDVANYLINGKTEDSTIKEVGDELKKQGEAVVNEVTKAVDRGKQSFNEFKQDVKKGIGSIKTSWNNTFNRTDVGKYERSLNATRVGGDFRNVKTHP